MTPQPEMTSSFLVGLLRVLAQAGIEIWLDGGWGVDALLGRQTRRHRDVDLVLDLDHVPELLRVLGGEGLVISDGSPPHSFVLADGQGHEVDVHAAAFDGQGNGVYRMQNGEDWIYPAEGFAGRGMIAGVTVQCLSAGVQVLCHAHGYTPTDKDFRDMQWLEESFELELPPQLKRATE